MCVIVVVINNVRVVSLGSRGFLFLSSRVICINVLYSCYDRVVVVFCSILGPSRPQKQSSMKSKVAPAIFQFLFLEFGCLTGWDGLHEKLPESHFKVVHVLGRFGNA